MAIVRFEQDPTQPHGTGNFTDDMGRTVYTTDPDTAKRLNPTLADQVSQQSTQIAAATVGAPQAAPDQRVASAPGATGSAATGQPAATAGGPGAQLVAKTEQIPQPAPAPAPAAAPSGGAGAALVGKLNQLPIAQKTTSTTVQQGRAPQAVAAEIETLRTADTGVDTAMREAATRQDERAVAGAQGEQAVALGDYQRNYQAAQEQRVRAETIEKELAMLRGEKDPDVNPTRLLDGMSTGKKIVMTLLAGLAGAFGALQGTNRNTFLEAIDARIALDVQNQREQIASGRLRRNNLIAHLQAQGASAQQAQLAFESRVYGAAANWARAKIQERGLQGAQLDQANLAIEQLDAQRAARDAALQRETEAKVSTATSVVRAPAQPAGGTMNPLQLLQLQNALLDQQDAAEVANITGKQLSPERVKELKAMVKEVGAGITETAGAVDMTRNLVEALGGKLDVTTGAITWPDDLSGAGPLATLGQEGITSYTPPGLIARAAKSTGVLRTGYDRAKAAQNALREYVTQNLTGATASAEQRKTFTEMVGATLANEEEVKENLQNWASTLFQIRKGQQARLTPEGQALYDHNLRQAQQGVGAPPLVPR